MANVRISNPVDYLVPLDGCTTKQFTQNAKSASLQKLGIESDLEWNYYYFVEQEHSIRTPDIKVPIHYRGRNPSRAELSAALGSDLFRAICWRESTWRQFDGVGRPLSHRNGDGTTDWGCMQINGATPEQIWDWQTNISYAKELFSEKEALAGKYLGTHPPVTDDMILREAIQGYNSGGRHHYYKWNEGTKSWDSLSQDGYVGLVIGLMNTKPWATLVDETLEWSEMMTDASG